jgi:hypothetical protein
MKACQKWDSSIRIDNSLKDFFAVQFRKFPGIDESQLWHKINEYSRGLFLILH